MITRTQFEQAVYLVSAAGADFVIDDLLERNKKKSGRPSKVSPLVFLVGALLVIMTRRRPTFTEVALVLNSLPSRWLAELGHPRGGVTADELYGLSRRLGPASDYSVTRAPHLDAHEAEQVRQTIQNFTTRVLEPSLIALPEGHESFAVDATDLESFEKRTPPPTLDELEALMASTIEHGEHHNPETPKASPRQKSGKGVKGPSDAAWATRTSKVPGQARERYWGYAGHAITLAPGPRGPLLPAQALHFVLTPANGDPIDAALRMLSDLVTNGTKIDRLLADRAYSNARFDRWLKELLTLGIRQVSEPRKDDYEFKMRQGIPFLFGEPYCPGTPTHQLGIKPQGAVPTQTERQARQEIIDELKPFLLVPKGRLKPDGSMKRACPIGAVACPLKEGSLAAAAGTDIPIVTNPPEVPHRVCTSGETTLRMESPDDQSVLKLHQDPRIGTEAHSAYFNGRTNVERFFSQIKWHDRFNRDAFQVRGLGMVTIIASLFVSFSNLRLLEAAHHRNPQFSDHPLIAIKEAAGEPMRPSRSRHR